MIDPRSVKYPKEIVLLVITIQCAFTQEDIRIYREDLLSKITQSSLKYSFQYAFHQKTKKKLTPKGHLPSFYKVYKVLFPKDEEKVHVS